MGVHGFRVPGVQGFGFRGLGVEPLCVFFFFLFFFFFGGGGLEMILGCRLTLGFRVAGGAYLGF